MTYMYTCMIPLAFLLAVGLFRRLSFLNALIQWVSLSSSNRTQMYYVKKGPPGGPHGGVGLPQV